MPLPPPQHRRLAVVLLLTGLLLGLGYLLKAQCIPDYNADRDRLLCSNDIQVLFTARGLGEHRLPYVEGGLDEQGRLTGGVVEYPVLTGLFAWLAALPVSSAGDYLRLSAVLLAPFGLLTAWLLERMAGWRALLWAATPPLVWYAFHNWDLLVVAATVSALFAHQRGRPVVAAALLGVGACLKLWPGFLVAPLVLERLRAGDRRGAGLVALAATAVVTLLNAPFLFVNPAGWWAPYAFQQRRAADITSSSVWFWSGADLATDQLNLLVPLLLLTGFTGALAAGWLRPAPYPVVPVCGAMLCVFLLVNKAHSPQFVLWLLPFLVLVRLPWAWPAAYLVIDTLLYVGLFRWFHELAQGGDGGLAKQLLLVGVWGRAALLVLLYVVLLRAQPTTGRSRAPSSTPPAGSSSPVGSPVSGSVRTTSCSGRSTSRTTSAA